MMARRKLGAPVIPNAPKINTNGQVFRVLSSPVVRVRATKKRGA